MKQGEENKKQPYDYAGLMREIRLEGWNLGETFGKLSKKWAKILQLLLPSGHSRSIIFRKHPNKVQFSSVSQLCWTLCHPMDCSTPGFPVHHQLPELAQTHVYWVSDTIQPSHPLSSPYPSAFNLSQYQFSSVQLFSRVRLFATPWIAAHQASLSLTNSRSLFKLMPIESVMLSSHFILCRPLLLLPPIPPSIRIFSSESTLRMRWPK